jgi:hypothetical protein
MSANVIDPLGGVQSVQVPYRPLVAIGEGTIVQLEPGLYAEVVSARMERRGGAWGLYLQVLPVDAGSMLTGFGEWAVDVMAIDVVT